MKAYMYLIHFKGIKMRSVAEKAAFQLSSCTKRYPLARIRTPSNLAATATLLTTLCFSSSMKIK